MSITAGLGWSEHQFWRSSLRYINAAVKAVRDRGRLQIEAARLAAWLTVGPTLPKPISLADFFPLEWDEGYKKPGQPPPPVDPEILKKFTAAADAALDRRKNERRTT